LAHGQNRCRGRLGTGSDAAYHCRPRAAHALSKDVGRKSASFVVRSGRASRERPDVARAWLKAERDAQVFLANPNNADEIVRILQVQTGGLSPEVIRKALYGEGRGQGAFDSPNSVRAQYPFVFTDEVMGLLADTAAYMAKTGRIGSANLRRWSH